VVIGLTISSTIMNASAISALAALAGAAIGGFTSIMASLLTQRIQARATWIVQEKLRRRELYKEFIEGASKCYTDALQNDKTDVPALAGAVYQDWQNARFIFAEGRRKRRKDRTEDPRYIFGTKQDYPRIEGNGRQ
jgi:hypothetical protein